MPTGLFSPLGEGKGVLPLSRLGPLNLAPMLPKHDCPLEAFRIVWALIRHHETQERWGVS
jgi:hypothetical protein